MALLLIYIKTSNYVCPYLTLAKIFFANIFRLSPKAFILKSGYCFQLFYEYHLTLQSDLFRQNYGLAYFPVVFQLLSSIEYNHNVVPIFQLMEGIQYFTKALTL